MCDFRAQNTPKCFASDPTEGAYSAPLDPLAGFQEAASQQGRERVKGKGQEDREAVKGKGRGGEGSVLPLLF